MDFDPIKELEKQFLKAKYSMQAEAIEGYLGNVRQCLDSFRGGVSEYKSANGSYLANWEGNKKAKYLDYMHDLDVTETTVFHIGEELIQELKSQAARLREKAANL